MLYIVIFAISLFTASNAECNAQLDPGCDFSNCNQQLGQCYRDANDGSSTFDCLTCQPTDPCEGYTYCENDAACGDSKLECVTLITANTVGGQPDGTNTVCPYCAEKANLTTTAAAVIETTTPPCSLVDIPCTETSECLQYGDAWSCSYTWKTDFCKECVNTTCAGQCTSDADCPTDNPIYAGWCDQDPSSYEGCNICFYEEEPTTTEDCGSGCYVAQSDGCETWQQCIASSQDSICGVCTTTCTEENACLNDAQCVDIGAETCDHSGSSGNCGECTGGDAMSTTMAEDMSTTMAEDMSTSMAEEPGSTESMEDPDITGMTSTEDKTTEAASGNMFKYMIAMAFIFGLFGWM